jgi:hypothetical protein
MPGSRAIFALVAALGLFAAFALSGCSGSSDSAADSPSVATSTSQEATVSDGNPAPQRLLGIKWEGQAATLVRVDPRSLRTVGREAIPLGRHTSSWTFSPDGSQVALGTAEDPARLRLIDLAGMRVLGDAKLGRGSVEAAAWLSPTRLVGAVETPDRGLVLFSLDAVERRVLAREQVEGRISDLGRLADRLVLLLSPRDTIGPSRLAVVDDEGRVEARTLDRIHAGIEIDEQSEEGIGRGRGPGLAIDAEGRRAYVVGAEEPVAEIDLDRMAVNYHSLAEPVSLLERVRNWLEPTAEAKGVSGPFRHARWLNDGLLAVSGYDDETYVDASGNWHYEGTPAGLKLIDTRDWSVRTIDEKTSEFWLVDGKLVALDEDGAIRGYVVDGTRRFAFPGEQPIGIVLTTGRYAYVFRMDNSVAVIDVGSGRILRRIKTDVQSLLAGDVIDY